MSETNTPASEVGVKYDPLEKFPDLKTIREVHGLTIHDIFLKTRISVTSLDAIENGEFHHLPAPVYAKKFIDTYAKAVGIDSGIILAHYQRYLDERRSVPEEAAAVKAEITFDRKPSKRYPLYAASAVAIIAIIFTMYAFYSGKKAPGIFQQNATVPELKDVTPTPVPAAKELPPKAVAPITVPEGATQPPGNPQFNLLIEATEDTWLKITEDRNPPYQITLKKGDTLNRTAREFFTVDVGNAAGVNITFHGRPLGSLGRKGQVVHLRLPQQ